MDTDLSVRDIKFLRAIRDINANPGGYEKTKEGAVPANKTSITLATDLGKKEVSYRLGGNHSRGFEDGDEPLIVSHDPEIIEDANRFGPRSAELTQHGIQLLSEFEASGYMGGGEREDEPETIKQLRARLDSLENDGVSGGQDDVDELGGRVDRLEAELESLKQSPWGAVDERYHSDLDKTVNRLPPMFYLLSEVFGFDVDRVAEEAPYDEETLVEVREAVVDTLGLDVSESDSDSGSGSGSGSMADSEPESMDDFERESDSSVSSDGGIEGELENESSGDGEDDSVPPHLDNPFDDDG